MPNNRATKIYPEFNTADRSRALEPQNLIVVPKDLTNNRLICIPFRSVFSCFPNPSNQLKLLELKKPIQIYAKDSTIQSTLAAMEVF
jgi:hypothetical protein